MTTMAQAVAGATSTGGVGALVVKKLSGKTGRKKSPGNQNEK
jgi:hypothetical protein